MIRRIVEYVAADRDLARAYLADLAEGRYSEQDQSPEYAAAHERVCVAEDELTPRQYNAADRITELVNKRLWVQIWDFEDDLERREIWRGEL
ncbi:MAG TPA: hypothetical protein VGL05_19655 [Kribbella sp.]